MIVTDAEGAALLEGLSLGVADDKVLVTGSSRYESLLDQFAGSAAAAGARRRGRVTSTRTRCTS